MQDFNTEYLQYKRLIDQRLRRLAEEGDEKPRSILHPLRYVLSGGGKRIRPILLFLAYEAVSGRRVTRRGTNGVLDAALAIEALHNFTLVHDDIMDRAPSRRGRPTVHSKWDDSTAILVGDELVALAYQSLLRTKSPRLNEILRVFTAGLLQVCEGQGFDKDFERRTDVTLDEYLQMIEKKTGRMVAVTLEIGGLLGNGSRRELSALRTYGYHLGRAFQIQDDLLDVLGGKRFGKRIGGDIIAGKKTYLLLEALTHANGGDRRLLRRVTRGQVVRKEDVASVTSAYQRSGAIDRARGAIRAHVARGQRALRNLKRGRAREMLHWLAEMLRDRRF
jgi:geranylgeranyl diphosphate synthase type II